MSYDVNELLHPSYESVSTSSAYKIKRGGIDAPTKEGYDRSHIFSWELNNAMNQNRKGRPLAESGERAKKIIDWMDSKDNIRYKTPKGNRDDNYWYSDSASDQRILESYKNPSKPLNDWDSARALRQYKSMMSSDIDARDKQFYKSQFERFITTDGKPLIDRTTSSTSLNDWSGFNSAFYEEFFY